MLFCVQGYYLTVDLTYLAVLFFCVCGKRKKKKKLGREKEVPKKKSSDLVLPPQDTKQSADAWMLHMELISAFLS